MAVECGQRVSAVRLVIFFCCWMTLQTVVLHHSKHVDEIITPTDDYGGNGPETEFIMEQAETSGDVPLPPPSSNRNHEKEEAEEEQEAEAAAAVEETMPVIVKDEAWMAEMRQLQPSIPRFRWNSTTTNPVTTTNSTSWFLPPIYWINLDASSDRRTAMTQMFQRLGLFQQAYRISAVDVVQAKQYYDSGRLLVHPNISLQHRDGKPSYMKHAENIYEFPEAACVLSHLQAIQQGFQDGHEMILVLEDDAVLSPMFVQQWKSYMEQHAPSHWTILQFATNNRNVLQQGSNLLDYFTTWQPYHWSTRAYVISRRGMKRILDHTLRMRAHSRNNNTSKTTDTNTTTLVWNLIHPDHPMVVADEILYYLAQESYTSAGLWVDAADFGSTIQSTNAHSNLTSILLDGSGQNTNSSSSSSNTTTKGENVSPQRAVLERKAYASLTSDMASSSIWILMSVCIRRMTDLETELAWIQADRAAICSWYTQPDSQCDWDIYIVLTDASLRATLERATQALSQQANSLHFHLEVLSGPFNKFAFLKTKHLISKMGHYDRVLFKDNDQRLDGFPWRTFWHRSRNAIVSGPLRQNVEEALLTHHPKPKRQFFQFHTAEAWTEDWQTAWSSTYYTQITPIEVPMLEMYFVMMDGYFAEWFYDKILTDDFVNQTSAWGPDLMWCPAARQWNELQSWSNQSNVRTTTTTTTRRSAKRPQLSCQLIPVTSTHEDTRQIIKNATTGHHNAGFAMVAKFKENPEFRQWMQVASNWAGLIGGKRLHQMEYYCRRILRNTNTLIAFDLQACADKMYHLDTDPIGLAIVKAAGERSGITPTNYNLRRSRYVRRSQMTARREAREGTNGNFGGLALFFFCYCIGICAFFLRKMDDLAPGIMTRRRRTSSSIRYGPPPRPRTIQERWF